MTGGQARYLSPGRGYQLNRRGAAGGEKSRIVTLRLLFHGLYDQFAIGCIDLDCISIANGTIEDAAGNTVFNLFLDDALERARSILRVVALGCQQVFRCITQMQGDMTVCQAWSQAIDLDLHNALHLIARDLMEDDYFIDTVDEFWAQALFS